MKTKREHENSKLMTARLANNCELCTKKTLNSTKKKTVLKYREYKLKKTKKEHENWNLHDSKASTKTRTST